jgi:CRP-like cAMP-binding protein
MWSDEEWAILATTLSWSQRLWGSGGHASSKSRARCFFPSRTVKPALLNIKIYKGRNKTARISHILETSIIFSVNTFDFENGGKKDLFFYGQIHIDVRYRTYLGTLLYLNRLASVMSRDVHKVIPGRKNETYQEVEDKMPADGFVTGNRLLAALPAEILERLTPELETVPLRNRDVVQRIGRQAEHVYFPHSGMGSIVIHMKGGVNVEAATVGNEGMLGLQYVLGDTLATEETVVQLPGEASRLRIRILRAEFDRDDQLRMVLLRYSQLLMGQIAQGAGCNRLHPIEERCARWLLSTHDRVNGDTFPLTQDFLALMLGVRRAGVSMVQHALQQDGLIGYTRGMVTIYDRAALEAVSCECYGVIRERFDRFLSYANSNLRPEAVG